MNARFNCGDVVVASAPFELSWFAEAVAERRLSECRDGVLDGVSAERAFEIVRAIPTLLKSMSDVQVQAVRQRVFGTSIDFSVGDRQVELTASVVKCGAGKNRAQVSLSVHDVTESAVSSRTVRLVLDADLVEALREVAAAVRAATDSLVVFRSGTVVSRRVLVSGTFGYSHHYYCGSKGRMIASVSASAPPSVRRAVESSIVCLDDDGEWSRTYRFADFMTDLMSALSAFVSVESELADGAVIRSFKIRTGRSVRVAVRPKNWDVVQALRMHGIEAEPLPVLQVLVFRDSEYSFWFELDVRDVGSAVETILKVLEVIGGDSR